MQETLSAVVPVVILLGFVGFFVFVSVRLRRGGGSLTTTILAATDEFLTRDQSKAAETIVNENAGKKFMAQQSGQPRDDEEGAESTGHPQETGGNT